MTLEEHNSACAAAQQRWADACAAENAAHDDEAKADSQREAWVAWQEALAARGEARAAQMSAARKEGLEE